MKVFALILQGALLVWGSHLLAQVPASPSDRAKNSETEKIDLNKVDFEQIEGDWESSPRYPSLDATRSPKLKDILEPSSEYSYASFGRPDPFRQPDIILDTVDKNKPMPLQGESYNIRSKLQMYTLQELTVKGYWQQEDGQRRAVVVMPTGEGATVKEGDLISSGKVIKIEPNRLSVRLYRIRADGVREHDDRYLPIGFLKQEVKGSLKFEPGKEPVFVRPEEPGMVRSANPAASSPRPMNSTSGAGVGASGAGGLPASVNQVLPQVNSVLSGQGGVSPQAVQQVIQQIQQTKPQPQQ